MVVSRPPHSGPACSAVRSSPSRTHADREEGKIPMARSTIFKALQPARVSRGGRSDSTDDPSAPSRRRRRMRRRRLRRRIATAAAATAGAADRVRGARAVRWPGRPGHLPPRIVHRPKESCDATPVATCGRVPAPEADHAPLVDHAPGMTLSGDPALLAAAAPAALVARPRDVVARRRAGHRGRGDPAVPAPRRRRAGPGRVAAAGLARAVLRRPQPGQRRHLRLRRLPDHLDLPAVPARPAHRRLPARLSLPRSPRAPPAGRCDVADHRRRRCRRDVHDRSPRGRHRLRRTPRVLRRRALFSAVGAGAGLDGGHPAVLVDLAQLRRLRQAALARAPSPVGLAQRDHRGEPRERAAGAVLQP